MPGLTESGVLLNPFENVTCLKQLGRFLRPYPNFGLSSKFAQSLVCFDILYFIPNRDEKFAKRSDMTGLTTEYVSLFDWRISHLPTSISSD